MSFHLFDTVMLDEPTRRTADGYLVTTARAGRVGIQRYLGSELGISDKEIVNVYRPADEVFKNDALRTFTSLPITVGHPNEQVDSKNWKKHSVGYTGEDVSRDGGYVRVPLILKDEAAIKRVLAGERELSFGYVCDLDMTPGKTEDGQEYDAVQRNLRGNHLAIVKAGRAGPECRIDSDSTQGDFNMTDLKTVTVDGLLVKTTDEGAAAISTLLAKLAKAESATAELAAQHKKDLDAKQSDITRLTELVTGKDKEAGAKDAEIATLKQKVGDTAAIDKMIEERSEARAAATLLVPDGDFKGKSVSDIRKICVAVKLGDDFVKGRDDSYLEASFDHLVAEAKKGGGSYTPTSYRPDPIADSMRSGRPAGDAAAVNDAHSKMVSDLENRWKDPLPAKH